MRDVRTQSISLTFFSVQASRSVSGSAFQRATLAMLVIKISSLCVGTLTPSPTLGSSHSRPNAGSHFNSFAFPCRGLRSRLWLGMEPHDFPAVRYNLSSPPSGVGIKLHSLTKMVSLLNSECRSDILTEHENQIPRSFSADDLVQALFPKDFDCGWFDGGPHGNVPVRRNSNNYDSE